VISRHTVQQCQYFLYFKEYLIIKGSNTVWSYFTCSSQFNFASVIFFYYSSNSFHIFNVLLVILDIFTENFVGTRGGGYCDQLTKLIYRNLLTKGVKWTNIQKFVYHWYANFWMLLTSIWKVYRIFFSSIFDVFFLFEIILLCSISTVFL
jgi:hypothetical protein